MKKRDEYWSADMKAQWNNHFPKGAPKTHENCLRVFGVARPGKTRSDRARRAS